MESFHKRRGDIHDVEEPLLHQSERKVVINPFHERRGDINLVEGAINPFHKRRGDIYDVEEPPLRQSERKVVISPFHKRRGDSDHVERVERAINPFRKRKDLLWDNEFFQNMLEDRPPEKEKKQEKWSQHRRSNSLPTSEGFSIDDPHIQITIEPDNIPRPTRRPTSVEGTSDGAQIGVNKISSLKRELYAYAVHNTWHRAKPIFDEVHDMVRIPLTVSGDTALHVAASANNSAFVEELVNLEYMTPKDLEILNVDGDTAFCVAAIKGNGDCLKIMMDKNEKLPLIHGRDGMLPVHLAALNGNHEIVEDLSSENLLQKMDSKHIEQLFFMTINSSMYDVAMKLVEKYSKKLVVRRYGEQKMTALHMLMRKPSESRTSSRWGHQLELLQKLWLPVTHQLEHEKVVELITHPSVVLFDAVESGNVEAVKWLLYINRDLLTIKDPVSGRNLLHIAVLHKQRSIFYFILEMGTTVKPIIGEEDKNCNNILHFAARQPEETPSSLSPSNQMQTEMNWFEEVLSKVPPELTTKRNRDGKTPIDILHANQEKVSKELTKFDIKIAYSGMVVAILVAAIAFAAALTVPGDKSNPWFPRFILANAVAFFTSAVATIIFLTIFLRSRSTIESVGSLREMLYNGHTYLFFSVVAMVVAFVAASFLISDHTDKAVQYSVISMGLLPVFKVYKVVWMLTKKFGIRLNGSVELYNK